MLCLSFVSILNRVHFILAKLLGFMVGNRGGIAPTGIIPGLQSTWSALHAQANDPTPSSTPLSPYKLVACLLRSYSQPAELVGPRASPGELSLACQDSSVFKWRRVAPQVPPPGT